MESLDIIALNRAAWNEIGELTPSPLVERLVFRNFYSDFLGRIPLGGAVLDLGCGPGLPYAKDMLDRGFVVTGVDLSDTMISAARRNAPGASFLRQSMTDINFEGVFDGVFACYSMLCLNSQGFSVAAARIARALRVCGKTA